MAPHAGIIIAASILVAAGLAAYENDQIRAWFDRTRTKIALELQNLGNDTRPRPMLVRTSTDASMMEDKSDAAEVRRQKAREAILERGRVLQERHKRRKTSSGSGSSSPSFDTLVDDRGVLRLDLEDKEATVATGVEIQTGTLRSRPNIPISGDLNQSVDASIPVRQFPPRPESVSSHADLFESRYEQEMRNSWNLPLPDHNADEMSSHASESLIDLTPTTEDFPDPDVSIPDQATHRSDYFSAASSQSSHTAPEEQPQFFYAHPSRPLEPLEPQRRVASPFDLSISSAPSIAGSIANINQSEAEISEDDLISEDDGIRTPASSWTEMGSQVSEDA